MQDFFIQNTTPIVSFLTLVLNIVTVGLLFVLIFPKNKISQKMLTNIGPYLLPASFLVAFGSVLGSLVYSEIIQFEPCLLCWWERIFIYPQLVILAIGLYVKEKSVFLYSLVFALLTILVSGYHTYLQLAGSSSAFCATAVVSCSKVYFLTYGYITIPTMALSVGLFFFVTSLLYKKSVNQNKIC